MATVFRGAGEDAGREAGAAFKRMFVTLVVLAAVYAFCEGLMLTVLTTHRGLGLLFLSVMTGIFLWWFARYANRRSGGRQGTAKK